MQIPTEGVALINLAAGAVLTWLGGAVNQRRQHSAQRLAVRREAYAALILALDEMRRTWQAPETLPTARPDGKMGAPTAEAVRAIHQAYVAVRLVASKGALKKAESAWSAAWDLSNLANGRGPKGRSLGETYFAFVDADDEFVKQAEAESAP